MLPPKASPFFILFVTHLASLAESQEYAEPQRRLCLLAWLHECSGLKTDRTRPLAGEWPRLAEAYTHTHTQVHSLRGIRSPFLSLDQLYLPTPSDQNLFTHGFNVSVRCNIGLIHIIQLNGQRPNANGLPDRWTRKDERARNATNLRRQSPSCN